MIGFKCKFCYIDSYNAMFATLSKFLNSKSQKISSAALTVAVFGLISRLFGLFRDRMLAGQFGAGQTLDIYYAAFKIPDLLYSFLIAGSIAAAFLPVFHEYLVKDKKEAWKIASLTLNFLFLCLVVFFGGTYSFFSSACFSGCSRFRFQARAIDGVYEQDDVFKYAFSRFIIINQRFLQAFSRFLITSLAPIFYNLGIIFGILFLVPTFRNKRPCLWRHYWCRWFIF